MGEAAKKMKGDEAKAISAAVQEVEEEDDIFTTRLAGRANIGSNPYGCRQYYLLPKKRRR